MKLEPAVQPSHGGLRPLHLGGVWAEGSPARLFVAGALLAALVDGVSAAAGGALPAAVPLALADAGLVALWVLGVVPAAAGIGWLERRSSAWQRALGALCGCGLALLVAVLVVQPVGRKGEAAYWAVSLTIGLVIWGVHWLLRRLRPHRYARALAWTAACVALGFDLWVDRSLYSEFHATLQWAAWTMLSVAFAQVRATPRGGRRRLTEYALIGLVALTIIPWAQGLTSVKSAGFLHGRWFISLAMVGAPYLDSDGDGTLAHLWGGDCDGSDPGVYPGAHDPTTDGRDSNCNGVVDPADSAAARGLGPAVGAPALPPDAVQLVLLVTVDTFRPELLRPDVMPHTHRFVSQGVRFERGYANASSTVLSMPYFYQAQHDAPDLQGVLAANGISVSRLDDLSRVLNRLDDVDARAFVHTHLMDLHAPYEPHPGLGPLPDLPPLAPNYVGEAAHADRRLAPLWEAINRPPWKGRVAVVLTGDHGEGAGEHGVVGHTRSPWDEVLRVPLAVVGPGVAPRSSDALATTRSVPATVLGAFGMVDEALAAERFGRSLWRRASDDRSGERFVVIETSRTASGQLSRGPVGVLVADRYKLVCGLHDGAVQLFDLEHDPAERFDLAPQRPELVRQWVHDFAVAQDLGAFRPALSRRHHQIVVGR